MRGYGNDGMLNEEGTLKLDKFGAVSYNVLEIYLHSTLLFVLSYPNDPSGRGYEHKINHLPVNSFLVEVYSVCHFICHIKSCLYFLVKACLRYNTNSVGQRLSTLTLQLQCLLLIHRYAVVALFVEVNSVFLHTRQLFIITGVNKKEPKYRLNSMINIGTFVIFRIAVLGWMTRWIVIHKDDLSLPMYTLGSVGKQMCSARCSSFALEIEIRLSKANLGTVVYGRIGQESWVNYWLRHE